MLGYRAIQLNTWIQCILCACVICSVYRATAILPCSCVLSTEPLPVTSLLVEVLSPSLASLTWDAGEGSQQDHYEVRYKGDMPPSQWSDVQHVEGSTETNLTDLAPGDRYEFEVTAYSVGQGSEAVTEAAIMCK